MGMQYVRPEKTVFPAIEKYICKQASATSAKGGWFGIFFDKLGGSKEVKVSIVLTTDVRMHCNL